ncbi:hypothetical protein [uncultured Flavobacterium sp.]|uniref:hypothetical protein n=1 Tax=uncultured Flavobacterium sp. TaxID=165435 RepID=UPI0025935A51|nr:hypothetical protein [uncultured Flavobacterium sp.]
MTTRKILVEQVLRKLSGGNISPNFAITDLEVGKLVDQVANGVIAIECKKGLRDDYVTTYENVPIVLDENLNLYYSDIKRVISLPNQEGVVQISSMQDQSIIFIACDANARFKYPNIADLLGTTAGYYNEQKKIFYLNYSPSTNITSALIKLVVDRSELDEEEDYNIPSGEIEDLIINLTLNKFQGK